MADLRLMMDAVLAAYTAMSNEYDVQHPPAPPPIVVRVAVGDNVQAAFTSLLGTGGTLLLAPGVHRVDLSIPERQLLDKLITVTSDSVNLPQPGQRIDPSYLPALAVLTGTKVSTNAVKGQNKSRNVAFVNVGIAPPVTKSWTHVALGGDKTETPTADLMPTNYLFDRVFIYGDPVLGAHRGIQMHCNGLRVTGCYVKDIFEVGRDAQALHSWNGGRNILADNNYLEASGENVMFGGSDSASVDMTTCDVVLRNNAFSKNFAWMSLASKPAIKNLLEVKNVKRLLVDGFLMENNWAKDWPTGVALMLKACNGENLETWATCEDVTVQNGIIRNVGSVFGIVGYGDSGRVSDRARRIVLRNILAYNINQGQYLGTAHGCPIANPPDGLTLDHVSMLKNGHSWMNTWFDGGQGPGTSLAFTNNVVCNSSYGYQTAANGLGMAGMALDWQATQVSGNAFQVGTRSLGTLPPNNAVLLAADFDASLDATGAVKAGSAAAAIVTTDGALPGANVAAILAQLGPGVTVP